MRIFFKDKVASQLCPLLTDQSGANPAVVPGEPEAGMGLLGVGEKSSGVQGGGRRGVPECGRGLP